MALRFNDCRRVKTACASQGGVVSGPDVLFSTIRKQYSSSHSTSGRITYCNVHLAIESGRACRVIGSHWSILCILETILPFFFSENGPARSFLDLGVVLSALHTVRTGGPEVPMAWIQVQTSGSFDFKAGCVQCSNVAIQTPDSSLFIAALPSLRVFNKRTVHL